MMLVEPWKRGKPVGSASIRLEKRWDGLAKTRPVKSADFTRLGTCGLRAKRAQLAAGRIDPRPVKYYVL